VELGPSVGPEAIKEYEDEEAAGNNNKWEREGILKLN